MGNKDLLQTNDNKERVDIENLISNITLTGYNSELSNKSFLEKRDMEKGFKESRLFLNKALHSLEHWKFGLYHIVYINRKKII
ncbi:MAG: DUF1524 domain-containing protein [Sulfurovum sp.]